MTEEEMYRQLNDIRSQMDDRYLTLAKIRDITDAEVVEKKDAIEFVKNGDKELCPFKSGSCTRISPCEIVRAERFIKPSEQQWLNERAKEFGLLEKNAFVLKRKISLEKDFP